MVAIDSGPRTAHVTFRELPLFERADVWRAYWTSAIKPYVGNDVLEVGAGIGSVPAVLAEGRSWCCLEPDPENFAVLKHKRATGHLSCTLLHGDISSVEKHFDTILYADVLEHIEDDRGELYKAARLLRHGGHLIVVAPAYQFLYTEFDQAIGHYRRYTRASLADLSPLEVVSSFYLDSVGMIASLGNRFVLHQAQPAEWSIDLWNRIFVPASRIVDKLTLHMFGKTAVVVWRMAAAVQLPN